MTQTLPAECQRIGGHDAPITTPHEDLLGATKIANAIHRTIVNAPKNWSTRIGLYGSWGSGKTSILNLLERLENDDGSIVVRSSAWSAVGEAGILRLLYSELANQFELRNIRAPKLGAAKNIAMKAKRFGPLVKGIARGAEVAGLPSGTSDFISNAAESAFAWLSIDKEDIESLVSQLNGRRVIIFIDDIDRADPRLIPKTLLALRELFDWPGFSFVMAFDRKVVARALTEYSIAYGENAQTFMEKVIDIPFEIAPMSEAGKLSIAIQSFETCCPLFPNSVLISVKKYLPSEPRRVKLVARKLGVLNRTLQRHGSDEIDWLGLLLHQIIHEYNPDAASFVVDCATSSEFNWLIISIDDVEGARKKAEFTDKLTNLILINNLKADAKIVSAGWALMKHWAHQSDDSIRYLINLIFDEPTFTKKEFSDLFSRWSESKSNSVLVADIENGAQVAHVSISASAQDFISLAISHYGEALENMADSQSAISWSTFLTDAKARLSFLEHLWSTPMALVIQEAATTEGACCRLIKVVDRWVDWDKSPEEKSLREREKTLALNAAIKSNAQEKIYCDTNPFWNNNNPLGVSQKDEWIESIRAALNQPVCERLIARFNPPDGLQNIVRDEEKLSLWFLESIKSPLYTIQNLAEKLVNTLSQNETKDARELAWRSDNARTYLHLLLGQAREGYRGGTEKIRDIHAHHPRIIPTAWNTVVLCRVPLQMVSRTLNLRTNLVEAGVPEEQLNLPSWLTLLAADLDKPNQSA